MRSIAPSQRTVRIGGLCATHATYVRLRLPFKAISSFPGSRAGHQLVAACLRSLAMSSLLLNHDQLATTKQLPDGLANRADAPRILACDPSPSNHRRPITRAAVRLTL